MVQSNYTVSTAHQLLGGMQPVRALGSKSKSPTPAETSLTTVDKPVKVSKSGPAPTRPLPPLPVKKTVRMGGFSSTKILTPTDRAKIRIDAPASVSGENLKSISATIYTPSPTTPKAKEETITLAPTVYEPNKVPVLKAPSKGKEPAVIEHNISQYFEYITPPISLGRTNSRRERKASHTPTSSAGSDIYFSPIDATMSQVFLSSPQPSPPISPPVSDESESPKLEQVHEIVDQLGSLSIETASAKMPEMVEIPGIGRLLDNRKLTLSLAHVDRITTSLAMAPLVQMRVRGTHLDTLPGDMTATVSDKATEKDTAKETSTTDFAGLPTPPPSEASSTDIVGGVALIDTSIDGAPVIFTTDAFSPGKCTHLSLPYGLSTINRLRIEPATTSASESKIILQSLFSALNRKTFTHDLTLLAETDVTPSFARAALTELAHIQNLTLDDLEIRTPTVALSPDESIDWCNIDKPDDITITSLATDILTEAILIFNSSFSAETCTMQTLTLLSELTRLQKAHSTFLILQPTRYDSQGGLAGVKIPFVSEALRQRFAKMDPSSTSANGGQKGRLFREAVIAAVAPRVVQEEEFETLVVIEGGKAKVRARCVPLSGAGDGSVESERWVCFLGGEFDVMC